MATSLRRDLRDFLRSRRARLIPSDVGFPDAGRRRTPGLRREEVAVLAGVGVSWYTWLEQGRAITVTTQVLDAVAGALRLDEAERAHLYRLAGHHPPLPRPAAQLPQGLPGVVERWSPGPAYVADRYWNLLVTNRPARELFGAALEAGNALWAYFGSSELRSRVPDAEACARSMVSTLRANVSRYPDDPEFARITAELQTTSGEFAELWRRHEVGQDRGAGHKVVVHPTGDAQRFDLVTLQPADAADLRLVLMSPH